MPSTPTQPDPAPVLALRRAPARARLRARSGRYAAECRYCECPDGCACAGKGCPCNTSKARS